MLGSCHSLYCNVFFGVHNELSKPSVLFCFFLSPPSPLLLFPPYRLCVCHICYQGNGTECNQNHASLSDYGGTVPLSTYFSFPPRSLSYTLLPRCVAKMKNLSEWMVSIHHKAWVISKTNKKNNQTWRLLNGGVGCKMVPTHN